mmetsp:Transcript_9380/g.16351  ORF Transcript_9380/g.16351 Transcript_9380/m.16351 type:complete len:91 (-) Transcript_9380:12-284(-)
MHRQDGLHELKKDHDGFRQHCSSKLGAGFFFVSIRNPRQIRLGAEDNDMQTAAPPTTASIPFLRGFPQSSLFLKLLCTNLDHGVDSNSSE